MKTYKIQPLDLMQYINTKYHEPFIHELIELENALDMKKLIVALDCLIEIFPLLKCHYDSEKNIFVENDAITGKDLLVIDDTANKQVLLTESLNSNERLIKLTISNNLLAITISHLVCDGTGFKQLIYLLCDFYNGNASSDYSVLMNREFSQLTKNIKVSAGAMLKMICSMIGGYKNTRVYDKGENEQIHIAESCISSDIMSKVHIKAKKQGVTLNDVFLTAYGRAISKLYSKKKINIPCTVDLRKYAEGQKGIANLTGTYNLNVKLSQRKSFLESLTIVNHAMNKQKKSKNDIAGPMLLVSKYEKSPLDKFLKLYGGMNTNAYTDYTNLGKLDENRLIFAGTTIKNAVGYSGLNKAPCFQIAISSFKGATTISSMFVCGEAQANRANELISIIAEEIKAFGEKNN
ncbi:MAG: hypothetical protein K2M84_01135 [Anaeroplasmataceae bacterium]|nr:hypothetical protein [Anaeroplasmataceae bacterium]